MIRTAGMLALMISGMAMAADPPIKPTLVSWQGTEVPIAEVIDSLAKQAGILVDRSAIPSTMRWKSPIINEPIWKALDQLSQRSNSRIVVEGKGERIQFRMNPFKQESSISGHDGPFRIAPKKGVSKFDFETNSGDNEITLDLYWEPRLSVFRVGGLDVKILPIISGKGDYPDFDRSELKVTSEKSKANVSGSRHSLLIRTPRFQYQSRCTLNISATITVTAAEKMLRVKFDELAAKQPSKTIEKVNVSLLKWGRIDDLWEARIELVYPPGMPEYESFEAESWLRDNACRLVSPDRSKSFESKDFQVNITLKGAIINYRFSEDKAKGLLPGKGWSLEVDTPSPLLEFPVKFELKGIKLP